MKLSYNSPFRDLINAYIDATEDDSLTWNQQDAILDEAETLIRQKVETNPDLLDAAPDMLQALELIVEEHDALFLMTAFIINGKLVNPEEHIRGLIAKAKGERT